MAHKPNVKPAANPEPNPKRADFDRNPIYQRRVVVFYDFLGWKNHITEAGLAPANLRALRQLILRHTRMLAVKTELAVRASSFSDNMVVTQVPDDRTKMLVQHLANIQLASALVGFLVRGAITVGNVVHDDEVVFGPGLNRAYELETTVAKYPRIILDPDVKKEFAGLGPIVVVENGVQFLDPFRSFYVEALKKAEQEDPANVAAAGLPPPQNVFKKYAKDFLDDILYTLEDKLKKPTDDAAFEKIAWLYDRVAKQVGKPLSRTLPRLRPPRMIEVSFHGLRAP
jgi:hypothetical protein